MSSMRPLRYLVVTCHSLVSAAIILCAIHGPKGSGEEGGN